MKLIKELPEVFEQFATQRQESFIKVKELKEQGIPVVGVYCTYFPEEIAMAMGAVTVGLCATSDETIPDAEADLPKNLCPLIKSSYGFGKTNKCPYFYFSDLVVGETTCDGKKKMYELMKSFKNIYVMELPNRQSDVGLQLWRQEIVRLKEYMEELFGRKISEEQIREAIETNNDYRQAMQELSQVMKQNPAPISGKNLFGLLYGSGFRFDKKQVAEEMRSVAKKIMDDYQPERLRKKPRILITGCPMGGVVNKVLPAIEENGGVVVGFENCNGAKNFERLTDESKEDVFQALAERYINIGCSVMTPNPNRFAMLKEMIEEYQVDGVVEVLLPACHTYQVESTGVRKFVTEEMGIPYTAIESDYSAAEDGRLTTRLAAFLEML